MASGPEIVREQKKVVVPYAEAVYQRVPAVTSSTARDTTTCIDAHAPTILVKLHG